MQASWLALAAVFVLHTAAFYPLRLPSDTSHTSSRSLAFQQQNAQFVTPARSLTLPLHRAPKSRQNTYQILNSSTPKQANSVAIDQDGSDSSYMVGVTFGDSKTKYNLLLDSAASNTWVMGKDCASDTCKAHNTLGTGDSQTLRVDTTPFNVTYGTGSINGTLANDTVHMGPLSAPLTFGLATSVSPEFKSYPMDGILAIGHGTPSSTPSLLTALALPKIYGLHLSRARDGVADGELSIGVVNTERYTGDINYLPAQPSAAGFWSVSVGGAAVASTAVTLAARTAVLDTGTAFMLLPVGDAVALHGLVPNASRGPETFSVPCSTTQSISLSFNNVAYAIPPADWIAPAAGASSMCRSNIIGRQVFGESEWLVGDVFLKNVYTVFDFDQNRVGFGAPNSQVSRQGVSASAVSPATSARPTSGRMGEKSGAVRRDVRVSVAVSVLLDVAWCIWEHW